MKLRVPHRSLLRFELRNRLLSALPPEHLQHLRPHLEPASLRLDEVLCDVGEPMRRVYFLQAGVVSLVSVFSDGTCAEMATVGREGVVGVTVLLGGDVALGRYVVQVPGSALVMEAGRFRDLLRKDPKLRASCEAYGQAFVGQVLQNVACNAAHAVERRCARWLLMTHDRSDSDTIALTQEYLGQMLGVRRQTVTIAARALQRAGLISYRRGAIMVLDRPGLEAAACECYRVTRDLYEQLLPHPFSRRAVLA